MMLDLEEECHHVKSGGGEILSERWREVSKVAHKRQRKKKIQCQEIYASINRKGSITIHKALMQG
jgi:hypothetical protein